MKHIKNNLITSIILMGQISQTSAALMRDDISVQVYRDFGENRGVFAPGAINVPVYHTDGSLSGYINQMPDFSSSVDGGYSTLISPQVAPSAAHVGYTSNFAFAQRYQQLDATLFSGAENADSYALMNEVTSRAYDVDAGTDYKLTRLRTVVTDAAPAELFTDTSQFKSGLLIARVGGGTLTIAYPNGTTEYIGYGPQAGGLNIINGGNFDGTVYTLNFNLAFIPKTALDVGTQPGDSGSGMWAWDTQSQSWKFLGVNSAGSGPAGYGKWTFLRAAPEWTQATIESFNDPAINTKNASDVIYAGAQDIYSGEGDFLLNNQVIRYHGIRTDIPESARWNTDFMSNKNIILGGAGGTFQLTASNLNLGAGSITFNANYDLSDGGDSSRRLNSAGYIINAGATVVSYLTGSLNDIWRKIGTGTLVIAGNGDNQASLNVGDGLTILQRVGGQALKSLHIGSGRATVRLGAANQLDGTQVGFGTRGGVLDLYGQSLVWDDIIHMDNGATIAATNANAISTFTFTGSGPKTYLGNFIDGGSAENGLLHLVYAPTLSGSSWTLKGNINTRGGMDINHGKLNVQGALTLHAGGYIDPTQYEKAYFDLGDSLVNLTDSQFTVGRNAMARGHFVLDDASSIIVDSHGEVGSSEQGIQEGAYLDGSVNLTGVNSTLLVTPDENFRVQINAVLSGAGRIVKEGLGTLFLTGPSALTGTSLISSGRVVMSSLSSLGATPQSWEIEGAGVLDLGDNADSITTILDKITTTSRGVLALSGALNSAATMAILPKDLYLGSGSYLSLGNVGENLTYGVQDLYLGGGDGEVSIKGYLPANGSSLFLGNGQSNGTIRIESNNQNWAGNIDLRRGIVLITDNPDALGDAQLHVNSGASAELSVFKNITPESAGMMSIRSTDNFNNDLSAFDQLAIGALSGETLTLNNTLTPTKTGYYFSGAGDVLVNQALANNTDLTLDAQDSQGGSVTLNRASDLNSQVTVRGYHSDNIDSKKSDMTLKLGVDDAIDKNSRVILEDGGVLDLNGHATTLNIQSSTQKSKILSSDTTNDSTLNLLVNNETTLNSIISGKNMHLIKSGLGILTLTGSNTFSGDVLLTAGKTVVNNRLAFGGAANIVLVAKDAILDLAGFGLENTINLDTGTLISSKAGGLTLNTLKLSKDSTATFNANTDVINIGHIQLNGHQLTVNNIKTTFINNLFDNGDVIYNQSNLIWTANNSALDGTGSLTMGNGTVMELRDVKQASGATKTLVLDGGTLASGTNGNGGGSGATLTSALNVLTSGTLLGNNNSFRLTMKLYGALSGGGTLNITGNQGVTLYGDTSAFNGKLLLKNNSKLYLASTTDTTLAANLAQEGTGKVIKQGDKSLTLTGDNHLYTNELEVQQGTLVLGSTTAATGGDIRMTAGNLIFHNDNKVSLSNLAANTTVDLQGNIGTLNIKQNAAGSTITSTSTDTWSGLNLLVDTNRTLNSTISGQKIHLTREGQGTLTLTGNNTFSGDTSLSGGTTILGSRQALGNAANNVTLAKNATLDLNGYDLINALLLDGGTLTSNHATEASSVNSTLSVGTSGTLLGNKFSIDVYGALSGNGALAIAGNYGATLYGDTELFNGSITVKNNSQLSFSSEQDSVLTANMVSESGSKMNKTGNTQLTLNGDNHLWKTLLEVSQGDLVINKAKSAPAGKIMLSGGRLIFDNDDDMTPDTILSGTEGSIIKRGSGSLTLNNDNPFNQETVVEEGILEIGDALHAEAMLAGDIQVNSGGTLRGYGSIGGDLFNSGIVRPAGAGKSLKVGGDYIQDASSQLWIDISPLEGASKLDVTGSATLNGELRTIYAPGTYTPQSYVILSALDGVSGEFATVTSPATGEPESLLSYGGNSVTLTTHAASVDPTDPVTPVDPTDPVTPVDPTDPVTPVDPTDPVTPVDPTDPVTPVDPTDPVTPVDPTDPVTPVDPIDPVTPVDPTDPVTPVDPTDPVTPVDPTDPVTPVDPTDPVTPVNPAPTFVVSPSNIHAYDLQWLSVGLEKPNTTSMDQVDWSATPYEKSTCDLADNCYNDDAMWIMPHMSNGSGSDMNAKINGISIGGYVVNGNNRTGVSVDYSDFDLSGDGTSASAKRYAFTVFTSQKFSNMVLTGSLGYTHSPTDVTRQVTSNGFLLGEGKSKTTADAVSSGISANWPIKVGGIQIVPEIGVDSLNVFYSSFDENMSSRDDVFGQVINKMKVHGQSNRFDSLQPNAGVRISHSLNISNVEVTPGMNLSYHRELMNNNDNNVYSNDGTMFNVSGNTLGRDILEYSVGVEVKFSPALSSTFSYTGNNQQGYQSQEGMIRVKYQF